MFASSSDNTMTNCLALYVTILFRVRISVHLYMSLNRSICPMGGFVWVIDVPVSTMFMHSIFDVISMLLGRWITLITIHRDPNMMRRVTIIGFVIRMMRPSLHLSHSRISKKKIKINMCVQNKYWRYRVTWPETKTKTSYMKKRHLNNNFKWMG